MPHASRATVQSSSTALALGLTFLALGFLVNPAFFVVALGLAGVFLATRQGNKVLANCIAALAIVLLLVQLGYGIGKDMAHRDNALRASGSTAGA